MGTCKYPLQKVPPSAVCEGPPTHFAFTLRAPLMVRRKQYATGSIGLLRSVLWLEIQQVRESYIMQIADAGVTWFLGETHLLSRLKSRICMANVQL